MEQPQILNKAIATEDINPDHLLIISDTEPAEAKIYRYGSTEFANAVALFPAYKGGFVVYDRLPNRIQVVNKPDKKAGE